MQLHVGGLVTETTVSTLPVHVTSSSVLISEHHNPVEVPESSFQPCSQLIRAIQAVDPLAPCSDFGKSL